MTKHLILTGLLLLGHSAQAKDKQEFECINNMYRQASFSIVGERLHIQDNLLGGDEGLPEAIQAALGTSSAILVQNVALDINETSKICSSTLTYLVDCQGGTSDASLTVEASIVGQGMNGQLSLTLAVQVKNLALNSSLASPGPVSLSGKSTSVALNQLNVESTADIVLNGRSIQLHWNPFFYTAKVSKHSYCEKF